MSASRSYWIQRNISELRPFEGEIVDVQRTQQEIDENRTLVRLPEQQVAVPSPRALDAMAALRAIAPADAALAMAWAQPSSDMVESLIESRLLKPGADIRSNGRYAPEAVSTDASAGTEQDLETRIDEPALGSAVGGELRSERLRQLNSGASPEALLQGTSATASGFIRTPTVLVISAPTNWDANAIRAALTSRQSRHYGVCHSWEIFPDVLICALWRQSVAPDGGVTRGKSNGDLASGWRSVSLRARGGGRADRDRRRGGRLSDQEGAAARARPGRRLRPVRVLRQGRLPLRDQPDFVEAIFAAARGGAEIQIPGVNATVGDVATLGVEAGYFVTPNVSVDISAGFRCGRTSSRRARRAPFRRGRHCLAPTPDAERTMLAKIMPAFVPVTVLYHFNQFGAFQPYLGGGVAPVFSFAHARRVQHRRHRRPDGRPGPAGRRRRHDRSALGLVVRRQEAVRRGHLARDRRQSGDAVGPYAPVHRFPALARRRRYFQPWVLSTGVTYRF